MKNSFSQDEYRIEMNQYSDEDELFQERYQQNQTENKQHHKSYKNKGIKKQKKQKYVKKQGRSTKQNEKKYWFSIIKYTKENPFCKLSWKNWKADNFFSQMQVYFQGSRNRKQIKSLDQRLKKRYLKDRQQDILDALPYALKEFKLDSHQQYQLAQFEKIKNEQTTEIQKKIEIQQIIGQILRDIAEDHNDKRSLQFILQKIKRGSDQRSFFIE